MNTIVFVEDDAEVGALIAAYLAKHDMQVTVEPRGDRAEETILRENPDLVLLDIMLPGKDGMTICRDLRAKWSGPIVLLTSLDSDTNIPILQFSRTFVAEAPGSRFPIFSFFAAICRKWPHATWHSSKIFAVLFVFLIYKSGLPVLSCVLKRMIMLHAWRCLRTFLQALFLLFWLK